MTVKTWKEQIEKNFTVEDITRFNELFELHASSMQFERISISNEQVDFVDSTPAGPVEDMVLKRKSNSSEQSDSLPVNEVIFLNVSDYAQIVFEVISLAVRHDFDIHHMLDELHTDIERYDCEDVLLPSNESEISL